MASVIPFAFEEQLVRVVERAGAPWFVGKDICHCLGIRNTNDALGALDEDEKGVASTDPLGPGGEQIAVIVSEPGVYRLVFRSRKPEAERFKRWLAHDVLPKLRREGRYEADSGHAPGAMSAPEGALKLEPLMHRLQVVREARALYGRDVARQMWRRLGLPDTPPPPVTALDEARQCLRHLLDTPVHDGGPWLRQVLENALDEDLEAQGLLAACGVRALPELEAFVVANEHPWLRRCFTGSEWDGPRGHMRVLRRLPGAAVRPSPTRIGGSQSRGTVLPADVLDER